MSESNPSKRSQPAHAPAKAGAQSDTVECGGQQFPRSKILEDGTELFARHKSHLSMYGFSISSAVLYMNSKVQLSKGSDVMDPQVPKVLEVKYMQGLSAKQLQWVTSDSVSGNGFSGGCIEAGLQKFNALYQDVVSGDSYCLSYLPDASKEGSLTLSKNGARLGAVQGNDLSKSIFSVWFGDYVWFKQMRDDLLGLNDKK